MSQEARNNELPIVDKWQFVRESSPTAITTLLPRSGMMLMRDFLRKGGVYLGTQSSEKHSPYIGGVGVTGRTLKEMDEEIPGVKQQLEQVTGKIIIAGNGLSAETAKLLGNRYSKAGLSTKSVIVDLFDYPALRDDLADIYEACRYRITDIATEIGKKLASASAISDEIHEGNVESVRYCFGSGDLPEMLLDADLVINCVGPISEGESLKEQLAIVRKGGKLITTACLDDISGFTRTQMGKATCLQRGS